MAKVSWKFFAHTMFCTLIYENMDYFVWNKMFDYENNSL